MPFSYFLEVVLIAGITQIFSLTLTRTNATVNNMIFVSRCFKRPFKTEKRYCSYFIYPRLNMKETKKCQWVTEDTHIDFLKAKDGIAKKYIFSSNDWPFAIWKHSFAVDDILHLWAKHIMCLFRNTKYDVSSSKSLKQTNKTKNIALH